MSISFRTGQYVDPQGFPLAVVNVPVINPNDNISLADNSYTWEENITSADSSIIEQNVVQASPGNSQIPNIPAETFLVTNQTVTLSNGTSPVPLYYKHICRFYHYTYGNNPISQVQITDNNGNVISGLAYIVQPTRISRYVYQINVLTNFRNPTGSSYKIKYNRCSISGTNIYPNWTETLSVTPLFILGTPTVNINQFLLLGPQTNGTYKIVVPPVPTLSPVSNILGVSISNSPAIVKNIVSDAPIDYTHTVTYTITATGSNTFTVGRDYTPTGTLVNNYLSSATANTWGTAAQFTVSPYTLITIPGISICINSDNALISGDQAYFQATTSYYYVDVTAYEAIYLQKPVNSTPDDDWYMNVSNGSFRRTMNPSGVEVPPGQGTTYQYSIPEYSNQVFDLNWGIPYMDASNERPILLDPYTISLINTPLFIDPSSVFNNPINPGFPPSGFITVDINSSQIPQTSITDWDIDNGIVTLGQMVNSGDDIEVSYMYNQNNYVYQGFTFNGLYNELNLNPTPGLGWNMYSNPSGNVATIYARPVQNVTASGIMNTSAIYHNFTGSPSGVFDFKLGSVSIGPNSSVSDVEITDVRTRSGGLNANGIANLPQVEVLDPESQFFWDIGYFDGQAVPADGVIIVNVPSSVLVSNGGQFTKDEVKEKVYKNVALGEFCIIQYC